MTAKKKKTASIESGTLQ